MPKLDPAAGRAAVEAYLAKQPATRREALEDVRRRVAARLSLDKGTIRFVPPQRLSDELLRSIVAERVAAIDQAVTGAARSAK
jgi:uncharacterized protein YdhG (YjbR/CyaY superfamily)